MKTRAHSSLAGSVLISVLVVTLGLVSITLLFANTAMLSYRASENDLAGRQAEQAVEAGARYAKYLLSSLETKGTLPDLTSYTPDDLLVGEAAFWFIGRPADDSTTNLTEPVFGLVDEASKLNLNNPDLTKEMLLKLPGMTEELANAIVTWRGGTAEGATADTYAQRQPSYRNKGAPFESVQELALLDGVDFSVLGGRDLNRNGVLDTQENDAVISLSTLSTSNVDGPGLTEYLTAFSRELNPATSAVGTTRINATSLTQGLRDYLNQKLTPERAGVVTLALNGISDIQSGLEFFMRSQMTAEEFDGIVDDLYFKDPAQTPVLFPVNVNTASAAVLACIPGLEDKAQEIVAARVSRPASSASLGWVAEILKDPAVAKQAGPFLTGKSSSISADVAAVGRLGRGYRRTQFILDASGETPKIIYRRNLASLGWALGREVRTILDEEKERMR